MVRSARGLGRTRLAVFAALSASLSAGYGVLFTVVGDFRDAYGISESQVGLIIGVGFLSAFVSQVFIAPMADRGHARTLVVAGILINVGGLLGMAFGGAFWPILISRVISGVGIGAALPAIRRIVIVADPKNLGQNVGLLLSADVAGFALGPAISAALVGPMGLAAPFAVVAGLTVLLVAAAWRTISTAESPADDSVDPPPKTATPTLAFDLLRDRVVAGAVVLGGAAFLLIGAFDALWDVVHEDLDTPTWMANLGITLFALPLVLLGPFGGRFAQRVGPFPVAGVGLTIAAGFMAIYGQLPTGSWIFGVAMVHAVTDGLTFSAAGVAISMSVTEERQAGAQGLVGAAQALAGGITAIVIGAVYESAGRATAYSVAAVAMVITVACGLALAAPNWRKRGGTKGSLPRSATGAGV